MASTWALHVEADLDEVNRHWVQLDAAGMLAAAEVDGRAVVYFAHRLDRPPLDGHWEHVMDRDWQERWRAGLTAVAAGRWTITPPWLATGADDELVIDPGQAFGTGHHETTVSCLRALDELALDRRRLLDVGTGTGVLAIAAARAGATVVALDVDPLAVAAARSNTRRNKVTIDIRATGIDGWDGETFDVVVANLDSATLMREAGALRRTLGGDGLLVAGGVSNPRSHEVAAALTTAGLGVSVSAGQEWSLLRARRATA